MYRVVILGGGFGGLAAAQTLRELLPSEDEIVLVERNETFHLGLRKTWALTRQSPLSAGQRPYSLLAGRRIRWLHGEIEHIDPSTRSAVVDGATVSGDALILALGAQANPGAIPGLAEYTFNAYSASQLERSAQAVADFRGGRVAVGVFGAPYPCPPAPFEISLLLADLFEARGLDYSLEVFSPLPMSLPVLGQAGCSLIESRLAGRDITFLPNHRATSVESGRVLFTTGPRSYDLVVSVPPHRLPEALAQSGMSGEKAWLVPEPATLETSFPDVYALGDCTEIPLANGMTLPKAGVFAEAEAVVIAQRIGAKRAGRRPEATLSGEGYCFLEVGGGKAQLVQGNFLARPAPQVTLTEPSEKYIQAKREFERERLEAWFGE